MIVKPHINGKYLPSIIKSTLANARPGITLLLTSLRDWVKGTVGVWDVCMCVNSYAIGCGVVWGTCNNRTMVPHKEIQWHNGTPQEKFNGTMVPHKRNSIEQWYPTRKFNGTMVPHKRNSIEQWYPTRKFNGTMVPHKRNSIEQWYPTRKFNGTIYGTPQEKF